MSRKRSSRSVPEPNEDEEDWTEGSEARIRSNNNVPRENVDKGLRLLAAIKEALPEMDAIRTTVQTWGDDYALPPLLRQTESWRGAVDKTTFRQFEKLVDFLRGALFGVDCDADSVIRFALIDMGREEDFLPAFRIDRVDRDAPLSKKLRQLELAKSNIDCLRERVKTMERCLESELKRFIDVQEMLARAKGCKTCEGKGWVKTDRATFEALDYGKRCRAELIGCNPWPEKWDKTFRLFCECQKVEEETEEEDEEEDD